MTNSVEIKVAKEGEAMLAEQIGETNATSNKGVHFNLKKVLYVPELRGNLMSVRKMASFVLWKRSCLEEERQVVGNWISSKQPVRTRAVARRSESQSLRGSYRKPLASSTRAYRPTRIGDHGPERNAESYG